VPAWHARAGTLYAAAVGLFVLALCAKTTASLLPPVLVVIVWWRSGRLRFADVRPVIPLFAVGAALAWHTAWLERTMVQATGAEWSLGLAGRVVLAGRALAFYAGKLVWPADLMFIYPRWVVDPKVAWQWAPAVAVLAALLAAFLLRRRVGRGPLAGALLFCGVLFPALGFFNVYAMRYSWVADHFAYQAVAVLAVVVASGIAAALASRAPALRRAGMSGGVVVLLCLAVLSARHARTFHDEDTLWRATLAANPDCFMCHANYGYSLYLRGQVADAVEHFEESLRQKPDNIPALLNLARVEEDAGRLEEAIHHLQAALAVDPDDAGVLVNLGTVLTKSGSYDEAIARYQEALRHPSPNDYLAHNGLGVALIRQGRTKQAVEHFREAVLLKPDYGPARANLERALAMLPSQP
jgi:tetratricopeptide (TPR) repeat protein